MYYSSEASYSSHRTVEPWDKCNIDLSIQLLPTIDLYTNSLFCRFGFSTLRNLNALEFLSPCYRDIPFRNHLYFHPTSIWSPFAFNAWCLLTWFYLPMIRNWKIRKLSIYYQERNSNFLLLTNCFSLKYSFDSQPITSS